MSDKQLKESWESIEPDRMAKERMKRQIFVRHKNKKRRTAIGLFVVANTLLIVLFFSAIMGSEEEVTRMTEKEFEELQQTPSQIREYEFIPDQSDATIKINSMEKAISSVTASVLIFLTEEELLAEEMFGLELAAFHGEVLAIHNLEVEFKETTDYFSVVEFEIIEDLRSDTEAGSVITIRMPGPIQENGINQSEMDPADLLTVGSQAIIMPVKYGETEIYSVGEETLYLNEVAEYGVGDGRRFIFIEDKNEIIFAKEAYPSFASMDSLEKIANRIRKAE